MLNNLEDENIEAQLELKADIDDVNAALLLKRNVSESYTITQTNNLLAPRATTAYVDGALSHKRNITDSYTITQTNELLAPKATTAYVDENWI